jgi:ACS family tartrate transporter-like MFS transporter
MPILSISPLDRAVSKAQWRLLPFLVVLYIIAYLDRINVSFAALSMNKELGLSQTAYGFGAGIFFLGYVLFEAPSNMFLAKIGPRVWIARIMLSWGLATVALASAVGPLSFATLRFILGVAEAGFFPGIVLYLTYWFPLTHRAKAVALFMTATPLAGLIGSPISSLLLELHDWLGLSGWQWLFILEGAPAVLLGAAVYFKLPNHPGEASWLSTEERAALTAALEREHHEIAFHHLSSLRQGLSSSAVWLGGWVYFCVVVAMYGLVMWLPQLVAGAAQDAGAMSVGLLVMIAYACAMVGMVCIGASSDKRAERRWHVLISLGLCLAGMLILATNQALFWVLAGASLAAMGIWGAIAPFWGLMTGMLTGQAAAVGIALINSLGNVGGFAGPYIMGFVKTHTGSFAQAFLCIAALMGLAALPILFWKERAGRSPR